MGIMIFVTMCFYVGLVVVDNLLLLEILLISIDIFLYHYFHFYTSQFLGSKKQKNIMGYHQKINTKLNPGDADNKNNFSQQACCKWMDYI
jgi:hypothetical protein